MLPVRVKPKENESMTSLIVRLSKVNGVDINTMYRWINNEYLKSNSNEGLRCLNLYEINTLSLAELINTPKESLHKCGFYNVFKIFASHIPFGEARFIEGMIRNEYCYCPECIKNKDYHKLFWTLSDINYCTEHEVSLLSKCPYCNTTLLYRDIESFDICPYCNKNLYININKEIIDDDKKNYDKWTIGSWEILLNTNNKTIECDEAAIRVIYILNGLNNVFSNENVKNKINNQNMYEAILRYARGTNSSKKMLHLSFIFKVLYQNRVSMDEFLNMEVPEIFIDSLMSKKKLKQSVPIV